MGAPAAKRFEIRRRRVCGAVLTLSRSLGTSGQAVACACHAVVSHSVRAAGGRSVDRPAAALSPEDGVAHHLPPLCASPLPSFRLHALPRALPPIRRESVAQAQRCVAKVTYSEPINKALGTSLLIPQVGSVAIYLSCTPPYLVPAASNRIGAHPRHICRRDWATPKLCRSW
jgi:hypothetical protein